MAYHVQPYFGLWNPQPNFHCGKSETWYWEIIKAESYPEPGIILLLHPACAKVLLKHTSNFKCCIIWEKKHKNNGHAGRWSLSEGWLQGSFSETHEVDRCGYSDVMRNWKDAETICTLQTTLISVTSVYPAKVRHDIHCVSCGSGNMDGSNEPTYEMN